MAHVEPVSIDLGRVDRRPRGHLLRRAARLAVLLAAVALLAGIGGLLATPDVGDLQTRVAAIAGSHGSRVIRPDEVPTVLARALVAAEDERFYQHHGVDVLGLGRAFGYDAAHLCACQGGSTITQQLAKEVYLGGSDAGLNKLADLVLALKIELRYSKSEILADYASVIAVGYGRWGMTTGACDYFGKPLATLDLAHAALLAGMPQAPSAYDPLRNPDAARMRRGYVLDAMVDDGYATAAQAAAANAAPLVSTPSAGHC